MNEADKTRDAVSRAYAKAVSDTSTKACCSSEEMKGVAAKMAGYDPNELLTVAPSAVANSFGCGNPLAFSEVGPGDVVVDLGSGAGIDILLAGRKVGPTGRVIGVDMTDEMIERARENVAASGLDNVEVRKGLIEDLPVESGSVDWLISNCVINLSPEKDRVFAEIARVLKPGGRMLVSDIVVEDLPAWARENAALYSSCIAGAISEKDYLGGLRRAGLVDVEVRERLVYDSGQLRAFVDSEVSELACCSSAEGSAPLGQAAQELAGKIWSAKVYARKPAP
ncbi:MAG: arsenite methyltransferase [Actinomycetota bacterium]